MKKLEYYFVAQFCRKAHILPDDISFGRYACHMTDFSHISNHTLILDECYIKASLTFYRIRNV